MLQPQTRVMLRYAKYRKHLDGRQRAQAARELWHWRGVLRAQGLVQVGRLLFMEVGTKRR